MNHTDRRLRVLLIGRHFWPLGSIDSAAHLMRLATGLYAQGVQVSVLAALQASGCSEQFQFREFDIHRPIKIFRSGWSGRTDRSVSRYIKNLRDWIVEHQKSVDLIYCDWALEECVATVEAAQRLGVPAVVRVAGLGSQCDLNDPYGNRNSKRCFAALRSADQIVVNFGSVQRQLIARGIANDKTSRIPIGIGRRVDQGSDAREQLRLAMARINGDLLVPDSTSVVLSVERMADQSGVMTLVQSARSLSERINDLQYWFVGDGPKRDAIYSQLKGDGLRQMMAMPGSFALMEDVFQAADLMVHTGDDGFQSHIPTAIACELPLVVASTEATREFFSVRNAEVEAEMSAERYDSGIVWFNSKRPRSLRIAIESIVDDLGSARQRSAALRRRMQSSRDENQAIQLYIRLFRRLVDQRKRSNSHRQGA